ncbi:MAG: hypothetical protein JSW27_00395 [Phycisphaerales bacterium]|nr:MAG: hypothetical protein JSW27_00395 [Phycisphaerales bacterium]
MVKDRSVAVLWLGLCLAACAWAQTGAANAPAGMAMGPRLTAVAPTLSSASVADRFREIAYELAQSPRITGPQADQAMIFLIAARRLDSEAGQIEPLLLKLAIHQKTRDYSRQVLGWLQRYVSEGADRAIISDAIVYLLDRQTSAQGREDMLAQLARTIGNRNAAVDSDLATLLGRQMVEKGDARAARFYFLQAYKSNKYNPIAFAKLAELAPNEIGPAAYLEHLRLLVRENPLDMDAVLNLAQYAERLELYDVAAGTFHCEARLFRYLQPTEPLPSAIYLPWAIACYNSPRHQQVCVEIAAGVRSEGHFDLVLEAVAGRAAARAGRTEDAQRILSEAEQRALQFIRNGPGQDIAPARELGPKQMAWFYCFAALDGVKALEWANKGYSVEPNEPTAGSLLAYALSMNGRLEWTKALLESFGHNQIADVVQGQVQLAEGDKAGAIATLAGAVAKDPGSLAAERARELLREQGGEYRPPVDARAVIGYLANDLQQTVVPQFVRPQEQLELQFDVRGSEFAYGAAIEGAVAVLNQGPEPLVITENGLFTGRLRVDVRVSGDLEQNIPELVSQTTRTSLVVPAGRSAAAAVRLSTGRLRQLLLDHPQASLDLEFTLYIDPVVSDKGAVRNRLAEVEPVTVKVRRPGLDLNAQYVRNRFNSIASGQQKQKLLTGQLFTGLLKEQQAMEREGTLYAYRSAEWLPAMLRSGLVNEPGLLLGGGEEQWVVQVNTMADMLSLSLDQELAAAVGRNLSHSQWPVRLMAAYLLATSSAGDFDKVLDWMGRQDHSDLVRSMAAALGSPVPGSPAPGSTVPSAVTPRRVDTADPSTLPGAFRLLR